jgi:hypothetical protein
MGTQNRVQSHTSTPCSQPWLLSTHSITSLGWLLDRTPFVVREQNHLTSALPLSQLFSTSSFASLQRLRALDSTYPRSSILKLFSWPDAKYYVLSYVAINFKRYFRLTLSSPDAIEGSPKDFVPSMKDLLPQSSHLACVNTVLKHSRPTEPVKTSLLASFAVAKTATSISVMFSYRWWQNQVHTSG